jgi:hypothetical protein
MPTMSRISFDTPAGIYFGRRAGRGFCAVSSPFIASPRSPKRSGSLSRNCRKVCAAPTSRQATSISRWRRSGDFTGATNIRSSAVPRGKAGDFR